MLKGLGGLAGLGDMAKMMKTAQDMQAKLAQMQEDLANRTVTGSSGAGLVTVTATAKGELTGISIDPSIFVPSEKEIAEDLILAAIKDAQSRAAQLSADEMARLAESMGIPPGTKLPF
jgi:DNA-binding YbaB/EbfC family protein